MPSQREYISPRRRSGRRTGRCARANTRLSRQTPRTGPVSKEGLAATGGLAGTGRGGKICVHHAVVLCPACGRQNPFDVTYCIDCMTPIARGGRISDEAARDPDTKPRAEAGNWCSIDASLIAYRTTSA